MEVKVRPARPSDKEPLMGFIKDVWGGNDYIPKVWDFWLRDKRGRMFVVEADGVPVGMNRVRFLEDGSAWFEGARVHPDFRGKGFATMLGENSMKYARGRGVKVFRLTSGSTNRTAHRQIARIGFSEAARFSLYEPPRDERIVPTGVAEAVTKDALPEATELIEGSREFRTGAGVFWHDFTAAALTAEVVRRLAERGELWRVGRAVAVAKIGGEGPGAWEEICFVGGQPHDAIALVKSLVGRNKKVAERWVFVPHGSPLIHELREEGYERNFSMILFERRAVKG